MSKPLTPAVLQAATGCSEPAAARFAPAIEQAMQRWGVLTEHQRAGFLGQTAYETGAYRRLEESLDYTAERLTQVWPKRFPSLAAAQPYARNPKALADFVYGGRMGNTQPGDGARFIGRGLIQLTGRDNYARYAPHWKRHDIMRDPEIVATPEVAADSAGWFWTTNGCNDMAERQDWTGVSKRINGGNLGLPKRIDATQRALKALRAASS